MSVARLEPLAPPFTGVQLDRASGRRADPAWVAQQLASPSARVAAASRDGVLLDALGHALARAAVEGLDEPILLGLEGERPLFALDLEDLDGDAAKVLRTPGARMVGLRDAGALLPRAEGGLAAYLVALLNWHRGHRYCANCGAPTELADAGLSRSCPRCGAAHFPRTDPVVIMLVEHDGRVLLGRRSGWPAGRYSVLAGFVSPGETLEEAVAREVREESGIDAYAPEYVTSQPWPFPASLMLGFEARSDGGQPVARDGELEEVGWFTREAVTAAARGDGAPFALPPPVSIARFLIERWLRERR